MKERIEFITESTTKGRKEISKINEYVNNFNFDCEFKRKIEQVPETFEEIKQLLHNDKKVFNKSVKKIEISEFMIEIHFKLQTICFLHNGEIVEPNCLRPIVTDRTPQQMWQIIKNLIGE